MNIPLWLVWMGGIAVALWAVSISALLYVVFFLGRKKPENSESFR